MRLLSALFVLPLGLLAADKAVVLDATWDRFSQHTDLRYTRLGTRSRIESTAADKPDPYLLVDTAQDQRITVYRHNSSWRLDLLEPKPRHDSPAGAPGMPAMPQPPPGVGPQGPIGPRTGSGATTANRPTAPAMTAMPEMPPMPQMPAAPSSGYGAGAATPAMPPMPAGIGPQAGMGPGAGSMPPMPGAGMGAGFGGGMPMPSTSAMGGREQAPTLTKTEETRTILGRTAVKYTITSRMMETVEIWAVPDTDLGAFFAYRPQPLHHLGPIDLQEQWDSLLRTEHLFPLLAVFKQADREIARFAVSKIEVADIAEPATFFAPPEDYYRCLPDPF
ncbi:MAG TPA: hypothetical protein VK163_00820 [Opitutaceae bacterium]|nr:hypothetical protein [Opitutaceae bacterium]